MMSPPSSMLPNTANTVSTIPCVSSEPVTTSGIIFFSISLLLRLRRPWHPVVHVNRNTLQFRLHTPQSVSYHRQSNSRVSACLNFSVALLNGSQQVANIPNQYVNVMHLSFSHPQVCTLSSARLIGICTPEVGAKTVIWRRVIQRLTHWHFPSGNPSHAYWTHGFNRL